MEINAELKREQNVIIGVLIGIAVVIIIGIVIHVARKSSIEVAYTTGTVADKEHEVWYTSDGDRKTIKHERWNVEVTTESGVDFTQSDRSVYRKVKAGQTVKVRVSMWYYKDNLMTTSYYVELEE